MDVIIIEDEKLASRRLERLLTKHNLNVVAVLETVSDSIEWFSNHPHPDLIFLDIQLGDGLSFEIFEAVEIKTAVIFTTAFDEYALQAFKLNSIDYLLKPIDENQLEKAIEKYNEIQVVPKMKFDFREIQKLLGNPFDREYKKRFTSQIGSRIKVISIDDIECFYSENKGTYAHTFESRNYLLNTTLDQLESELSPEQFFRINRKFIIRFNAIKDIISYSNSRLKIILNGYNENELIVARERVKDFRTWLE